MSDNPTRTTGWGRTSSPGGACCASTWSSSSPSVTAPAFPTSPAPAKRPLICFTMNRRGTQLQTPAPCGGRTPTWRWILSPQTRASPCWRPAGSTPKCAALGPSPRQASTWPSRTWAPACLSSPSGFSSRSAPPPSPILPSSQRPPQGQKPPPWWSLRGPAWPTPWRCPSLWSCTATGTASGWFPWARAPAWLALNPLQTTPSARVCVFNRHLGFYLTKPSLYAQCKSPQPVPSSLHLLWGSWRGGWRRVEESMN